jgi:hypothetical protein
MWAMLKIRPGRVVIALTPCPVEAVAAAFPTPIDPTALPMEYGLWEEPTVRTALTVATCSSGVDRLARARAGEAVRKCREERKHFTPRRKDAKDAKRTKLRLFASLCALAPWREIVHFFTPSDARGTRCVLGRTESRRPGSQRVSLLHGERRRGENAHSPGAGAGGEDPARRGIRIRKCIAADVSRDVQENKDTSRKMCWPASKSCH